MLQIYRLYMSVTLSWTSHKNHIRLVSLFFTSDLS